MIGEGAKEIFWGIKGEEVKRGKGEEILLFLCFLNFSPFPLFTPDLKH